MNKEQKETKRTWRKGEEMCLRICVEIQGIAEDENGNPCPAGACVELDGVAGKDTSYDEIIKELSKELSPEGLLRLFYLKGIVSADDIRLISPEEYDEKYRNSEGEVE